MSDERHFRPGEQVVIRGTFVSMEKVGDDRHVITMRAINGSHHHPSGYVFGIWSEFVERGAYEPAPEPPIIQILAGTPVDVT